MLHNFVTVFLIYLYEFQIGLNVFQQDPLVWAPSITPIYDGPMAVFFFYEIFHFIFCRRLNYIRCCYDMHSQTTCSAERIHILARLDKIQEEETGIQCT